MNMDLQLSLRSQVKLLKKSIQKELIVSQISIYSKSSNKAFLFWLKTIIPKNNPSESTIETLARSIASELIKICQEKNKLTIDKNVINSISKTYTFSRSLQPPLESTAEVELKTSDAPISTSIEPIIAPPLELLELFAQNQTDLLLNAWREFTKQLDNAPLDRLPTSSISEALQESDLVVFRCRRHELAFGNSSEKEIDIPVAKMPGVEVGTYKELRSDLRFKVGTGDDGNQYITQWGNENRGGLQIDAKNILLFIKE